MVYKILYQELPDEAPVRERTETLYVKAQSVRDVRQKLQNKNINIEFIQHLTELHLDYEKQSENFVLESV